MRHLNYFGSTYKINQYLKQQILEILTILKSKGVIITWPLSNTEKSHVMQDNGNV